MPFRIIIIGAGISGLAAANSLRHHGHSVLVLEKSLSYQPLGGALQLGPSASRCLIKYGMRNILEEKRIKQDNFQVRRYKDGKVLYFQKLEDQERLYGAPAWGFARYNLQVYLGEFAISKGVEVRFGSLIKEVDLGMPAVVLESGERVVGDLIVGADGLRSVVRRAILGYDVTPVSPINLYNVHVPREKLASDPEFDIFVNQNTLWYGPGTVIVVIQKPDFQDTINFGFGCDGDKLVDVLEGDWEHAANIGHMKKAFSHFAPVIRRAIDLAATERVYVWRLTSLPPLERWVSESGKAVLVGDAAHSVLPYTGMGAGLGVEDAACLAECIARAKSAEDLPGLLRIYQDTRKPRAEWVAERGFAALHRDHLPDGPEQEVRDAIFAQMQKHTENKTTEELSAVEHIDHPPGPPTEYSQRIFAWLHAYDIFEHTRAELIV